MSQEIKPKFGIVTFEPSIISIYRSKVDILRFNLFVQKDSEF